MDLPEDEETMDLFLEKIKNEYKGQWTEENWEEEMEKHPLFMTKAPEQGENGELPPDVEAIRQLQWDPDINDPREIALKYKDEGNLYFKVSKYKQAVQSYTEGLKQKMDYDKDLMSVLHQNRAAAHFRLKNVRSALTDCILARKFNKNNVKAMLKGVECLIELKMFDDCIKWCEQALLFLNDNNSNNSNNSSNSSSSNSKEEDEKKFKDFRSKAEIGKKQHERDLRKKEADKRKKAQSQSELLEAIKVNSNANKFQESLFVI
jgi:hypothetical protein